MCSSDLFPSHDTVPQVVRIMKNGTKTYIGNGNNFVDDLFKSYGHVGVEAHV